MINWAAMQAVSALEARARFPGEAALLAEPRVREFGAVDRVPWARQWTLDIRTRARSLARIRHWRRFRAAVDEIAIEIGAVKRLFVGHLGLPICHIANVVRPEQVVVLDAGVVTPKVARLRGSPPKYGRLEVAIRHALLGLRTSPPPEVTFFTAYDLCVERPDRVVQHGFEQLRAQRACDTNSNETWFIGQNVVEGGVMTAARYEAFVRHVASRVSSRVRYVPHPREEPARLAALASSIDIDVTRFDHPIELELLARPWPAAIVGVCSSALHSAATICGGAVPVRALRVRGEDLLRFDEGLDDIYETLRRGGVQIERGPA